MHTLRRAHDRGHANHGWLDSRFSFSFADYYDPAHMNFRSLRVINEDIIQPGTGFGTHPHKDMEIITYVIKGGVTHRDSTGGSGVITPGDIQIMHAGSGIHHSEHAVPGDIPTHMLQIWLEPHTLGVKPSYEQQNFSFVTHNNTWQIIASGDNNTEAIRIYADATISITHADTAGDLSRSLNPERYYYLHVAQGQATVNGFKLSSGDALAIDHEQHLGITIKDTAQLLLFDLE